MIFYIRTSPGFLIFGPGDGSLDASELRAFAAASLPQSTQDNPLFYETFDKNGDKKLDKDEFYDMMVFFEVKKRIGD